MLLQPGVSLRFLSLSDRDSFEKVEGDVLIDQL